jgi:hypothetical protein
LAGFAARHILAAVVNSRAGRGLASLANPAPLSQDSADASKCDAAKLFWVEIANLLAPNGGIVYEKFLRLL